MSWKASIHPLSVAKAKRRLDQQIYSKGYSWSPYFALHLDHSSRRLANFMNCWWDNEFLWTKTDSKAWDSFLFYFPFLTTSPFHLWGRSPHGLNQLQRLMPLFSELSALHLWPGTWTKLLRMCWSLYVSRCLISFNCSLSLDTTEQAWCRVNTTLG